MTAATVAPDVRLVALRALGPATAAAALYGGVAAAISAGDPRTAPVAVALALFLVGLGVSARSEQTLVLLSHRAPAAAATGTIGLALAVALLGDGASQLFLGLLLLSGLLAVALPILPLLVAGGALATAYSSLVDPADPHVALQVGSVGLLLAWPLLLGRVVRRSAPIDLDVPVTSPSPLTPRQLEALNAAAEGLLQPEIAERLGVSVSQVRRLLAHARERSESSTTAAAVAAAKREGQLRARAPTRGEPPKVGSSWGGSGSGRS